MQAVNLAMLGGAPAELILATRDEKGREAVYTRVFLPPHDWAVYWRFRCRPDFTSYIGKVEKDEETGTETFRYDDVSGFRVAALSRVAVAVGQVIAGAGGAIASLDLNPVMVGAAGQGAVVVDALVEVSKA